MSKCKIVLLIILIAVVVYVLNDSPYLDLFTNQPMYSDLQYQPYANQQQPFADPQYPYQQQPYVDPQYQYSQQQFPQTPNSTQYQPPYPQSQQQYPQTQGQYPQQSYYDQGQYPQTPQYIQPQPNVDPNQWVVPPLQLTGPGINDDAIRQYDYNKAYDPLEQPLRRVPRYEMAPMQVKQFLDLPTRGYPDNFSQIGLLLKTSKNKRDRRRSRYDNDNSVLRLFSRQTYPGSNKYDYYTMVSSGNDQIKINIKTKKNELYENDKIFIKALNSHYKVHLEDYDLQRYYPDILY